MEIFKYFTQKKYYDLKKNTGQFHNITKKYAIEWD